MGLSVVRLLTHLESHPTAVPGVGLSEITTTVCPNERKAKQRTDATISNALKEGMISLKKSSAHVVVYRDKLAMNQTTRVDHCGFSTTFFI